MTPLFSDSQGAISKRMRREKSFKIEFAEAPGDAPSRENGGPKCSNSN
jgi:hypothetical protein